MHNEFFLNTPEDELVGKTISIMPHALLNKSALYTTQDWIDDTRKLRAAVFKKGLPPEDLIPSCHLWIYKGNQKRIVMTDGNHRTGIACLNHEPIDIQVQDIWRTDHPPVKIYPFNKITRMINLELSSSSGMYDFEP